MKKSSALAYVGFNERGDREKDDFYPTPDSATQALLDRVKLKGNVWEPACGNGAMSKVLINNGYDVYSSDLIDRGYGETGIDFLKSNRGADNIVTNPPFNLSLEFTLKALELANDKVIMLSKISYLEGIKRREQLFNLKKLKQVLVFSRRVPFKKQSTNTLAGGLMAFGWFVYDINYNGLPTIDWI
jgi:type I restriction-modification system DNA methylase subunit